MRRGIRLGDLTLAEARVGARIKCVVPAGMSLWEHFCPHQHFYVPEVGKTYLIRASGLSYKGENGTLRGVLLHGIVNAQVTIPLPGEDYGWSGEPFFLLSTFVLVTQ